MRLFYITYMILFSCCFGDQEIGISEKDSTEFHRLHRTKGYQSSSQFLLNKKIPVTMVPLFLANFNKANYGADKVAKTEKYILLNGKVWLRDGEWLWDGRGSDESYVKFDIKTMRILEIKGTFEQTFLLK